VLNVSQGLNAFLTLVAAAAVVASFAHVRARNKKNALIERNFVDQEILIQIPVMTRAVNLWAFNALPLKGVIRVEMTLRSESLQLSRPKPLRQAMLYQEFVFSIATSRFAMGQIRFPFKKRNCIIVSGDEFGTTVKQAIYSKSHMHQILEAFQRAGVHIAALDERTNS
jgi:hypothetical protein